MARLFEPISLRGMTARNRAWLSAMCQYSAVEQDGLPTDWHLVHLGARATGGFGLIMAEAAAVLPEGRITRQDVGLWSDEAIAPWGRIARFAQDNGAVFGIQLAHAGRKASTYRPFDTEQGAVSAADSGWESVGPSAEPFDGLPVPRAMSSRDISNIVKAFAAAAARADQAGCEVVEVHAGHGYLLHQFLSPLANRRSDGYGGSFENRTRLLREVVEEIRTVWPDQKPLFVRLSASDWIDGGWDLEQTIEVSRNLAARGVDLIDVSSGGLDKRQNISLAPGYQVPFAGKVRSAAQVPTAAVGLITESWQAESILADRAADAVFIGRAALREPSWPQRAANELGIPVIEQEPLFAPQHLRGLSG